MQIILVRHSEADHNRRHSYGTQQEFDSSLTNDGVPTVWGRDLLDPDGGIEQAIACGDALVQHLFDGKNSGKEWEKDFAWEKQHDRKHPSRWLAGVHPQPMKLAPEDVQIVTSLFPRARQSTGHILDQFRLAGFPLRDDQTHESGVLVEVDMPYKRMNAEARASLRRHAARNPDSPDADRIQVLTDKKRRPAIVTDRYPYAPPFAEIQKDVRAEMERIIAMAEEKDAKACVIVSHAVTLHAIRGLLCNIPPEQLERVNLQGNASALVIDLPNGIGTGTALGYVHGRDYARNDLRSV